MTLDTDFLAKWTTVDTDFLREGEKSARLRAAEKKRFLQSCGRWSAAPAAF
jgi:hypothetical protein